MSLFAKYSPIILRSLLIVATPYAYCLTILQHRLFYRALLQKRHIILRSLLIVATPNLKDMSMTQVLRNGLATLGVRWLRVFRYSLIALDMGWL